MRRLFNLLAAILLTCSLQAQDANLLNSIRSAGKAVKSFECDLVNTTIKKSGKTLEQSGNLYFVTSDKFAALFDTDEYMIVNEDRMKINVGIFHGRFRLREDGMMRSLSNIFLYGFQGRCQDLADENNYTISLDEDEEAYYVIFDNNKKSALGLGYKQVVFTFDRDDLRIRQIKLFDNKGTIDTYDISNIQYNVKVAPSKFEL